MEKSLKSHAINFGIYLGISLSVLFFLAYFFDLDLFVNFWYGISIYLIAIVFGTISIIKTKISLNSFISFKNAFSMYFLTILIGLTISSLVSYVIFNFIDSDSADILKEKSIEKMVEVLEKINKPQEEINTTVDNAKSGNLYSISNVFQGLIFNYLVPLSIIGLLVAATMKKNNPDEA